MSVSVTHSKTLVAPDSGVDDKVYGADYVAVDSHTVTGLGTAAEAATTDFDAAGAANTAVSDHVALADPHTQYQKESEKDAAGGYAGLSAGSKLAGAQQTYGSAANTACEGNDSRLADSRAPNGSASGDLAGSYPSPTVSQARGLRETAGPTTLTMGAVADGEFLKRSGTTVVGGTPSGGVSDGDKGDITVSGSGATWTIDAAAVTLAKMENRATQTLIGRNTAGSGAPEELSIATAKTMLSLTGTNSGDQTITLTGNVTGTGTGSFATTIAAGVVTRAMLEATGKNWQFLGTATASAAVRTGTITWSGTFKQLWFEYFISGYSGSAIGRLIVGPTAGLSETGTTFCTELIEGVTRTTTSVSVPGWPTAVTAGAVARYGWMRVSNVAGVVKRMEGKGLHSGTAASAVPTNMLMNGLFNDTSNLINKAELAVYAAITGTAISSTTFNSGTYLNVWGRNDD